MSVHGQERAATPELAVELLSQCLTRGDLEGALALYESGATFAPRPGESVSGIDAIRAALQGFVDLRPTLSGIIQRVLRADDIALVVNRWSLTGTQPDGHEIRMEGVSADVVRRQADGTWRVLIDDPWGAD